GIVESWGGDAALGPEEAGRIAALLVAEGQRVGAGQMLATLDDAAERATLAGAEADVAGAEAALARTSRGATAEERRQARAEAEASDARATFARANAERMRALGRRDAVPVADVERASSEASAERAAAEARAARRDL